MRGTPPSHLKTNQSGFTLVEVMVVLLIIGLMAGAVVLNAPTKRDILFERAEKMSSRLQIVSQEAMVSGQVHGVALDKDGYSVLKFEKNEWQDVVRFEYQFDGAPVLGFSQNGAKISMKKLQKANIPVIRYDTTGIATPFSFSIENQNTYVKLVGAVDGTVNLVTDRTQ